MMVDERSILVVEDSDEDFDTMLEAARRSGLRSPLVRAVDGEDALMALEQSTVRGYRLVILDNNLPGGLSGYDVLVEMRTKPGLRHLPTVMFTTSSSPRDCLACYRAGANAYHVKPVAFDDCLRTLDTIFDYWLSATMSPTPEGARP